MPAFAQARQIPPIMDIQMSETYGQKDMSLLQMDINWDFFYSYVGTKAKDMILEVRSRFPSLI